MKTKGKASELDRHIGQRIRLGRKALGMSAAVLTATLGVSYQQILKYKNGPNRITASQLHRVSNTHDTKMDWFVDDQNGSD